MVFNLIYKKEWLDSSWTLKWLDFKTTFKLSLNRFSETSSFGTTQNRFVSSQFINRGAWKIKIPIFAKLVRYCLFEFFLALTESNFGVCCSVGRQILAQIAYYKDHCKALVINFNIWFANFTKNKQLCTAENYLKS